MRTKRTTQEEQFALLADVPPDERPPSGDVELDRMLRLTDLLRALGPGSAEDSGDRRVCDSLPGSVPSAAAPRVCECTAAGL